jgi:hypothetical protein
LIFFFIEFASFAPITRPENSDAFTAEAKPHREYIAVNHAETEEPFFSLLVSHIPKDNAAWVFEGMLRDLKGNAMRLLIEAVFVFVPIVKVRRLFHSVHHIFVWVLGFLLFPVNGKNRPLFPC